NVSNTRDRIDYATAPTIAVDSSGGVGIAYFASIRPARADIFFSRSTDGRSFSTPLNLSRVGGPSSRVDVRTPFIEIDSSGNIRVVYIKVDLARNEQDVYFTQSTDGGMRFSEPINASRTTALGIISFVPAVSSDRAGNIGIAWSAFTSGLL